MPDDGRPARLTMPDVIDELATQHRRLADRRRRVMRLVVACYLASPVLYARPSGLAHVLRLAALIAVTAALIAVISLLLWRPRQPVFQQSAWAWLAVMLGLAVVSLAVGGIGWVGALIMAAAAAGRISPSQRVVGIVAGCAAATGLGMALALGVNYGNGITLVLVPPLIAFVAYAGARRNELVYKLRETRAELARAAVAEERLRIARDLHDLLGHSLSLITLKAELAGRLIGADPDRAARELADLESVARRSLGDVRAAVTNYRQPSLAAELTAARQMLAAAGIEYQVRAPASIESVALAPEADALLAWAVREGITNVVRHSGARGATITITAAGGWVSAEVADDGVGPPMDAYDGQDHRVDRGSGLVGLAERARQAGGELSTGRGSNDKGFRLEVRLPASAAAEAANPAAGPANPHAVAEPAG